jgi:DNA repair protein RadA/Sms
VYDRPLPSDAIFLGEVGLAGVVRPISLADRRLGEAERMGMRRAYLAERSVPRGARRGAGSSHIEAVGVRGIADLFEKLFA